MKDTEVRAMAALLRDLRPKPPGATVGENLMWRRIVEGIASLVPADGRQEFLAWCGWDDRSLFGTAGAHVDDSGRTEAARIVQELRSRFHMTDERFQALHHRTSLRRSDGISAHLRFLANGTAALHGDQLQLARRLKACRDFLAAGESWAAASRKAEKAFPGSRSR